MNIEQTISDLEKEYQNQAAIKAIAHANMVKIKRKIGQLKTLNGKANEVLGPTALQDLEKIMDSAE